MNLKAFLPEKQKKDYNNDDGGDNENDKTKEFYGKIEKENILTSLLHIGTIRKDVVMDAEIFPTAVPKIFEQLTKSLAAKMQT